MQNPSTRRTATQRPPPNEPALRRANTPVGCRLDGVAHLLIYVGAEGNQTVAVDAPYAGVDVRVEPLPAQISAAFGSDIYVGAIRTSQ